MRIAKAVRLPTRRADWLLVGTTLRRVFSGPTYVVVALLAAGLCLSAVAVARNGELFVSVVVSGHLPLANRAAVLAAIYPFVGGTFERWAALAVVALALLSGVNAALLAYHFRELGASIETGTVGSVGLAGAVLGGLGAGCAVCGTSLFAGLLSLLGVVGGTVVLPFDGVGLTLVALGVVVLSSFWIVEGMHGGMRRREVAES